MIKGVLVVNPTCLLYAIRYVRMQIWHTPRRRGHADHRNRQRASFCHRVQRGEDHFVREIARHAEKHQCVRLCGAVVRTLRTVILS